MNGLFKETCGYWESGSIVWGGGVKITIWFFCYLRHFIVGSYSMLNWWYLYMFTVFILHTCVYGIAWFCRFFYIINVFHDFFNELCKYIIYNCRLMLISICWYMSCCKIDDWHHNTCDICAYCMILFDFLNFFGIFSWFLMQ